MAYRTQLTCNALALLTEYTDGLLQSCGIFGMLVMDILQSYTGQLTLDMLTL